MSFTDYHSTAVNLQNNFLIKAMPSSLSPDNLLAWFTAGLVAAGADIEGIVAKHRVGSYEPTPVTWFKTMGIRRSAGEKKCSTSSGPTASALLWKSNPIPLFSV